MMRLLHLGLRWWDRHHLSERLRALAVFLPGVLLVVVIHVLFLQLDQGRDLVRLTLEHPLRRGVLGLAVIALAYVSWYGARVVAFLRWARTGRHPRIRSVLPRLIGHGTYMAALVGHARADAKRVRRAGQPPQPVAAGDPPSCAAARSAVAVPVPRQGGGAPAAASRHAALRP
ncbi:MAG: hypothetical protein IPG35_15120 [Flavobacteriales bacterium]|nr:hypothetical protein [Flavobacteriales bacterium]